MRLLIIALFLSTFAQAQTVPQTGRRPTVGNPVTRETLPAGRPARAKSAETPPENADLMAFKDLYKCEDNWMSIDSRPEFRNIDCPEITTESGACASKTRQICIGTTKCGPKNEEVKKTLTSDTKDPQYLFTQFEYTAACTAPDKFSCKKPTDCVAEDMSSPLWSKTAWDDKRQKILRKRTNQ